MTTGANETASTLLGAALLLASTVGFGAGGAALVRAPLAAAPRAVRLVGAAIAATSLLVVVSLALLFAQCYRAVPFALVAVGVGFACWRWAPAAARPLATAAVPRRARRRDATLLLAAVGGTLLLAHLARALLLPPLAWDALTYHLPIPALWIQAGGYAQWAAPDAWGDYSRYPANGELVAGFLMLPFHGDVLVGLMGLPFLLLGGAALFALARELGAAPRAAGVAAALWVFAPPALGYVATQYVDVPMAAEAIAGFLFLIRFGRAQRTVDGALAGAAFGLAAGTKHLALLPLGVACVAGLWLLLRLRARAVRGVASGALAAAALGAPWYVRSWIETGNPVYPFRVALGDRLLFAGSTLQANVPVLPVPTRTFLDTLFVFEPPFAPLTYGPPAAIVIVLGAIGVLRGLAGRPRGAWLLLTAAAGVDLALFCSERMRMLRDYWSEVSQRFLLVVFAVLLAGLATLATGANARVRRLVLALALGALALDFAAVNPVTMSHDQQVAWLVLALLAAAAAAVTLRPPRRWLVALGLLAWFGGVPWLAAYRATTRHDAYERGFELHLVPRPVAGGWRAMDDPEHPRRIAFTGGWTHMGQHWFVYPLLGRRLQNTVLYVPSTVSGALGTYQPDVPAEPRASPDEWIERLRRAHADVLFVALPPPPELAWAEARPDVFVPRAEGPGFRIFDLR